MSRNFLVCVLLLGCFVANSQQNFYFISFANKDTNQLSTLNPTQFISSKAIARRVKFNLPIINELDLPVNNKYIQQILSNSITLVHTVKWLNGIVVKTDLQTLDSLKDLVFVKDLKAIGTTQLSSSQKEIDLNQKINLLAQKFDKNDIVDSSHINGLATQQLALNNIDKLHERQFKGENILIAVFDAGFKNLNQSPYINQKQVIAAYNMVDEEEDIFDNNQDEHGLNVVGCIAADADYRYKGSAPKAQLALFKTETTDWELPIEEYYWVKAAEIADSLGVDIINSSVGYTEFDNNNFGHRFKEFSGNKTPIAKAANIAVSKGMVVVVSAGNDGDKIWEKVSTPADADSVITIAACDLKKTVASFSSIGFVKGKNKKPELAALGENTQLVGPSAKIIKGNGTSYATPIMTGAIACLLQAYPNKNPASIKNALILSANQYDKHTNTLGFGIADLNLAYQILDTYTTDTILDMSVLVSANFQVCLHSIAKQKVEITIQSADEKVIYKQKEKLVAGINRFELPKTKKIQPGVYVLKIKTNAGLLITRLIV